MPRTTSTASLPEPQIRDIVDQSDGTQRRVHVLEQDDERILVNYLDDPNRPDEWIELDVLAPLPSTSELKAPSKKRKRRYSGRSPSVNGTSPSDNAVECSSPAFRRRGPRPRADSTLSTRPGLAVKGEEDEDYHDPKITEAKRNVDMVHFGDWKIKTWYYSPYPLTDSEIPEIPQTSAMAHEMKLSVRFPTRPNRWNMRLGDILTGTLNKQHWPDPVPLYVCDRCFKYFSDIVGWEVHQRDCERKNPPGRKAYHRDPVRIWEIDGEVEKLYCQNLSLFGKFFIDVKTIFFDLDNFMFYVLTCVENGKENVIGFFSKEKKTYDDYNLACIVTFPQWQRTGYGMLMIEFSYELSRRAGKVGGPERPLSILGLRGYLSYWVSVLIRFFRRVLSIFPPRSAKIFLTIGSFPDPHRIKGKPRKRTRNGNVSDLHADNPAVITPLDLLSDPVFTSGREFVTRIREDGGAETHLHVDCTLADVATATNLRPEDAAFALNEVGLLMKRMNKTKRDPCRQVMVNGDTPSEQGVGSEAGEVYDDESDDDLDESTVVVITRAMIERVASERSIKRAVLDLNCVLDAPPPSDS